MKISCEVITFETTFGMYCQHVCVPTVHLRFLLDIDECGSSRSPCDHYCTNTDGGYYCECTNLDELRSNGNNCTRKITGERWNISYWYRVQVGKCNHTHTCASTRIHARTSHNNLLRTTDISGRLRCGLLHVLSTSLTVLFRGPFPSALNEKIPLGRLLAVYQLRFQ